MSIPRYTHHGDGPRNRERLLNAGQVDSLNHRVFPLRSRKLNTLGAIAASADTSKAEGAAAAAGETALSPSVFRCADRARGGRDRVPEPRRKINT